MRYVFVFFFAVFHSLTSWAVCPPHKFAEPRQIKLHGDSVMIAVHSTSTHDARFSTKRGLDEAVRFAKSKGIPVIYLQDDTPEQFYFMEDCEPDYWAFSQGGEINFEVLPTNLYIVGGHLELCMSAALHDILYQWAKRTPQNLTVTYFMDGIYSNGKVIDKTDPFWNDFVRFSDIITYGRPGGEHWMKLTLLETMGIILREDHELEYIKQILPRWDTTFPEEYRVVVQMNGSPQKVLRTAPGWSPPTLAFRFFDSALNLSSPFCTDQRYAPSCAP
jgi:hypothetical protein